MESNNTMKYLIGALVVTAIIVGYFYFGGGGSTSVVKSGVVPVTAVKADAGGDPVFLQALLGLKNADMSKDILNSQILNNLKDFSRELVDEPKGRVNPFAPFDKELQSTTNFTQTNTQTNNQVPPNINTAVPPPTKTTTGD